MADIGEAVRVDGPDESGGNGTGTSPPEPYRTWSEPDRRPDQKQMTLNRVLMIADVLAHGGAERQLALLASSILGQVSVRVITMSDGPYRQVLENAGVAVVVTPRTCRFDVRPAVAVWRAVRDWRPSVVHSWGLISTAAALPACRRWRVPLVEGSIRVGWRQPRRGRILRFLAGRADAVVANSNAGLRAFGFDHDRRGHVVYNGFDKSRLLGLDVVRGTENRVGVVMAARMRPVKDFSLLLQAATVLGEAEPDRWRFILAGSGSERERLLAQARRVRGCVLEFPETGLEVLPAVASADIGVLLTAPDFGAEGCSNTIQEYMALGLPVVCSDGGGNREIVEDGISGIVIPPADVDALVRALRSLGSDADLRARLGNAGREFADSRFSVERYVEDFLTIYREVSIGD